MSNPVLITEPRYPGCIFTRNEAEGAIPNGTHIRKVNGEFGDGTPDGTIGVVVGSLSAAEISAVEREKLPPPHRNADYAYFVEWRTNTQQVVGVIGTKIERSE